MTTREKFKRAVNDTLPNHNYCKWIAYNDHRCEKWNSICDDDDILSFDQIDLLEKKYGYVPCDIAEITENVIIGFPITLDRVSQAMSEISHKKEMTNKICDGVHFENFMRDEKIENAIKIIQTGWKFTKKNGQSATDDDQTDETIEKLLNLLTK